MTYTIAQLQQCAKLLKDSTTDICNYTVHRPGTYTVQNLSCLQQAPPTVTSAFRKTKQTLKHVLRSSGGNTMINAVLSTANLPSFVPSTSKPGKRMGRNGGGLCAYARAVVNSCAYHAEGIIICTGDETTRVQCNLQIQAIARKYMWLGHFI